MNHNRILLCLLAGSMLFAGCEPMRGYGTQVDEKGRTVVRDPVPETPVINEPIADPPVGVAPIPEPPDDPIPEPPDDPLPEPPEFVEFTDDECDAETYQERCDGDVMTYCAGPGKGTLVHVDCEKYSVLYGADEDNPLKCVTFNVDGRVTAGCDDVKGYRNACTPSQLGQTYSDCQFVDYDYLTTNFYYIHATMICAEGDDGYLRWTYYHYNDCSDSCSATAGCVLEPCSKPGTIHCTEQGHILECLEFEHGNYYVRKEGYCGK